MHTTSYTIITKITLLTLIVIGYIGGSQTFACTSNDPDCHDPICSDVYNGNALDPKPPQSTSALCDTFIWDPNQVASTIQWNWPWSWTCSVGAPYNNTVQCWFTNGVCGSTHWTTVNSLPTANLCDQGTASFVFGAGPYLWTCSWTNGGSTASCNAQQFLPTTTWTSTQTGIQIRDVNCISSTGAIVDPIFCTGPMPATGQTVAWGVCNTTSTGHIPILWWGGNGNTYTCQNGARSPAWASCSPASAPISYDMYSIAGWQDFIQGQTQCATSAPISNCSCFDVTNTNQILLSERC